jgi:hypothetical protein
MQSTAAISLPNLQKGSSGIAVRILQRLLQLMGNLAQIQKQK